MKRLQLFEFEDAAWFPPSIRASMTRMITVLHGWFQSPKHISTLLSDVIRETGRHHIVDFCSGDGGPMIEALAELQKSTEYSNVSLTLTDLYPNRVAIDRIAATSNGQIVYRDDPVDATQFRESDGHTIRTIIAGFITCLRRRPRRSCKALSKRVIPSLCTRLATIAFHRNTCGGLAYP